MHSKMIFQFPLDMSLLLLLNETLDFCSILSPSILSISYLISILYDKGVKFITIPSH